MRNKFLALLLTAALAGTILTGCADSKSSSESSNEASTEASVDESVVADDGPGMAAVEDGVYDVDFDTDSSMFHVNEACDGKAKLIVENGQMTVHITLVSKKILNLYPGLAEDAQKDGAAILEPTIDEVTYSDGFTEEVFGFDVPVPYLDEEFNLALVGEKGTWYDHKVSVSNPVPAEESGGNVSAKPDEAGDVTSFSVVEETALEALALADGSYTVSVKLEGGSGKATVNSPCELRVEEGAAIAVLEWSSPYYDFMIVDGEEYQPVNEEGNSVFEIPVSTFGVPVEVQADTIAMSKPHLIDYTLTFASEN